MGKKLHASAQRPRRSGGILSLTWPIFIELLLQMLVGNADQIMVGWYDPNGVGAIGNANQITNLLLLVFSVICTASMILIAQYIGAEDTKRVNETYTVSLVVNGIFGLAIGGPTYNGGLFPVVGDLLRRLAGREVSGHKLAYFGGFTWASAACKTIAHYNEQMKMDLVADPVEWKQGAGAATLDAARAMGRRLAEAVLSAD